jgi:hypothetical protein
MTFVDGKGPVRAVPAPAANAGGSWSLRRILLAGMLAFVVGLIVGAASAEVLVLYKTGAPWPEAIPPYIQFRGTNYSCQDLPSPPGGLTPQAITIGGGVIYAPPPLPGGNQAPLNWVVVAHGSTTVTCLFYDLPASSPSG